MEHKSYREESKKDWGKSSEGNLTIEQVNIGALLRIADATEVMATRYNDLLRDLEWVNKDLDRKRKYIKELENKNRGLKGTITKLKKKVSLK